MKFVKLLAGSVLLFASAAVADTGRIPIDNFAMLPVMSQARVSPDGKKLAVVRATSKAGDYIIEIYDTDDLKKTPKRAAASRMEITSLAWVNNDRMMVNFRQLLEDRAHKRWVGNAAIIDRNLKGKWLEMPENSELLALVPSDPDNILITYDDNDDGIPYVMRFNVYNGRMTTAIRGTEKMGGFIPDYDGEIRGSVAFEAATGSLIEYARVKGSDDWKEIFRLDPGADRKTFDILGFVKGEPNSIYVKTNLDQDTAGVYALDIETGKYSERIFGLKSVDVEGMWTSNRAGHYGELLGFNYSTDYAHTYWFDPEREALQKGLEAQFPDRMVNLSSNSDDDNMIVVFTQGAHDPGTYYLLKNKSQLEFLGARFPLLEEKDLADVDFTRFTARDGLEIPVYVTKPHGKGPFPTVVLPHGGPWARDEGGFDEWAQMLASQGYLVIQPQFRGSDGFGLNLWTAGDAEWGQKMQDDMDDAALHYVKEGLADRNRLAMFGWSYGGYSAFVGSLRPNNIYKCTIAGAGVSDLNLLNSGLGDSPFLRKYQRPTIKGVSPVEEVANVNVPILVIHGDIDQRVEFRHSERFVDGLKKHNKDYKFIVLKDADHFYNTLSYDHKTTLYNALVDWLGNKCFPN